MHVSLAPIRHIGSKRRSRNNKDFQIFFKNATLITHVSFNREDIEKYPLVAICAHRRGSVGVAKRDYESRYGIISILVVNTRDFLMASQKFSMRYNHISF